LIRDPALDKFWKLVDQEHLTDDQANEIISWAENACDFKTLRDNIATLNKGEEIQAHKDFKAGLASFPQTEEVRKVREEIEDAERWNRGRAEKHAKQVLEAAGKLIDMLAAGQREDMHGQVVQSPALMRHCGVDAHVVYDARGSLGRLIAALKKAEEHQIGYMVLPRVALAQMARACSKERPERCPEGCSGECPKERPEDCRRWRLITGDGWQLIALAVCLASGKTIKPPDPDDYRKSFQDWLHNEEQREKDSTSAGVKEYWPKYLPPPRAQASTTGEF
jgi:hypothetical protein